MSVRRANLDAFFKAFKATQQSTAPLSEAILLKQKLNALEQERQGQIELAKLKSALESELQREKTRARFATSLVSTLPQLQPEQLELPNVIAKQAGISTEDLIPPDQIEQFLLQREERLSQIKEAAISAIEGTPFLPEDVKSSLSKLVDTASEERTIMQVLGQGRRIALLSKPSIAPRVDVTVPVFTGKTAGVLDETQFVPTIEAAERARVNMELLNGIKPDDLKPGPIVGNKIFGTVRNAVKELLGADILGDILNLQSISQEAILEQLQARIATEPDTGKRGDLNKIEVLLFTRKLDINQPADAVRFMLAVQYAINRMRLLEADVATQAMNLADRARLNPELTEAAFEAKKRFRNLKTGQEGYDSFNRFFKMGRIKFMPTDELQKFVDKRLKEGADPEAIKQVLIEAGRLKHIKF